MDSIKNYKSKYGNDAKIGFIGCGNMASAILNGILQGRLFEAKDLMVSNRAESTALSQWKSRGVATTLENLKVISSCPIVFLCVKPNGLEGVADSIVKCYDEDTDIDCEKKFTNTIVSILAGTALKKVKEQIPIFNGYIRAMPNTPLQVSAGCTALSRPVEGARNEKSFGDIEMQFKVVEAIFMALGVTEVVEETKFDAVTGLSGSGPAYVYIMIEALSDAGVKQGLPRDVATKFAAQTLFGASKTVLESGLHPGVLKDQVTSSGGTTIHAIHALEKGGIRNILINAVEAATNRSKEMSNN